MTAEVDVANFALGHVGIGQTITALTDETNIARQCKRWFDQTRDEVLRDFPWGFATRTAALAHVSAEDYPGYAFVYQYPNDCLNMRSVGDEAGVRLVRMSSNGLYTWLSSPYGYPYDVPSSLGWRTALRADGATQVILSDIESAWGFYTARVTNLGAWPVDAIQTFALKLGGYIGGPLQANAQLVQSVKNAYVFQQQNARAAALNESKDDRPPDSPSITARL